MEIEVLTPVCCMSQVNTVGEVRSTQQAPTVVISERATSDVRAENSAVSYRNGAVSIPGEGNYNGNA